MIKWIFNSLFIDNSNLIEACKRKDIEYVKYLLEFGTSVNYVDGFKKTPLIYACRRKPNIDIEKNDEEETELTLNIINLLVEKGANVNYRTPDSTISPLFEACITNNIHVVRTLIIHGANINVEDSNGLTLLYIACIYKKYE